jgi:hypothetical protein
MARLASQALGGFFATPTHLLPVIARLFTVGAGKAFSIVDPCAGEGEAVVGIAHHLFPFVSRNTPSTHHNIYTCEMEATRAKAMESLRYQTGFHVTTAHGDAMRLVWSTKQDYGGALAGASLLYLNAPYDQDRQYRRLEERFLSRMVGVLGDAGALAFVVPYYALEASADTLARNFYGLHAFRFPDPDFGVFKQCVVVGTRRVALWEPDPIVRARVMQWATDHTTMPILGSAHSVVEIPGHGEYTSGFSKWSVAHLDVQGLVDCIQPWSVTERSGKCVPIVGVTSDTDVIGRKYPLAVPPKPAHLAAAIASGVFNGARVCPDSPASKLPALRVKGVFRKDFVTAEEKQNKDGDKTGEIRIQQPQLVVTVLDVAKGEYHVLKSTAEKTGAVEPSQMSTGDLITEYGRSLMGVMREQCPVLHDPANDTDRFALPTFPRPLYRAQEEVVRACVKLLGGPAKSERVSGRGKASRGKERIRALRAKQRDGNRGKTAYILGEIGGGKSGMFLAVAATLDARRVVVTCPPHLTQSWVDQAAAVVPWARVQVVQDVDDVDAFCLDTDPSMSIAVMSRSAKLTHRWDGISGPCPKCGASLPVDSDGITMTPDAIMKARMRCGYSKDGKALPCRTVPAGQLAHIAQRLALALMLVVPRAAEVNQRCRSRVRDRLMIAVAKRIAKSTDPSSLSADAPGAAEQVGYDMVAWSRARNDIRGMLDAVAERMIRDSDHERMVTLGRALLSLLGACGDEGATVERIYRATVWDPQPHGAGATLRAWCRDALLLLRDPRPAANGLAAWGREVGMYSEAHDPWDDWQKRLSAVTDGKEDPEAYRTGIRADACGGRSLLKIPLGSPSLAVDALSRIAAVAKWRELPACGEPLYHAIPEPRKVSLTAYLARKYPRVPDLLGIDEIHELGSPDSAQTASEHRLVGLGVRTIGLTGSFMNGYAKSCHANQWAMDPHFRDEFKRDELRDFCRRYGYVKVLVQETDRDGKVVAWGSQSERRETVKEIGYAPGVLPLFLLRYPLRMSATLHKADLALDLPPHEERVERVEAEGEHLARYAHIISKLKEQIKSDRFQPGFAGKLFGQLSEAPSYLDRATDDCGNVTAPASNMGDFDVAYPEGEPCNGRVLISYPGLPAAQVLPKERRMLEVVEAELKEDRRIMLFAWHDLVLPRLQRLVERELGETCALLDAGKVQARKRQAWIDSNVIAKKRRVLVVNPVAVQTGLNNLVWFHSVWWHENPGVNPIAYRQAVGRIDRIGKTKPTRSYFAIYDGTAQALAMKLLIHKVAVSQATDGLDAESALQAAGVGSADVIDAFSVGRALWEMMERGEVELEVVRATERPTVAPTNDTRVVPTVVVTPAPAADDTRPKKGKQLSLF